jgi:hypothetical protein
MFNRKTRRKVDDLKNFGVDGVDNIKADLKEMVCEVRLG